MSLHTSNNFKLNHAQLLNLLTRLGYSFVRATGGHLIFTHPNSKRPIALRHARKNEIVPMHIVKSIIREIVYSNIATEAKLNNEIENSR